MSTSRSWAAAWATAIPGPPNNAASGAGSTASGSTIADLSRPGDLNEGEVRDVGALGVELGVEAVERFARELADQRIEAGCVVHHERRCRRRRRHGGATALAARPAFRCVVTAAGGGGSASAIAARLSPALRAAEVPENRSDPVAVRLRSIRRSLPGHRPANGSVVGALASVRQGATGTLHTPPKRGAARSEHGRRGHDFRLCSSRRGSDKSEKSVSEGESVKRAKRDLGGSGDRRG